MKKFILFLLCTAIFLFLLSALASSVSSDVTDLKTAFTEDVKQMFSLSTIFDGKDFASIFAGTKDTFKRGIEDFGTVSQILLLLLMVATAFGAYRVVRN